MLESIKKYKRSLVFASVGLLALFGIAQTEIPSGGMNILNSAGTAVIEFFDTGDAEFTGDVTANAFIGDGSGLTGVSGSGDVTGPASSTDNALTRFDSTTGKVIQNSTATLDDSGNLTATSFIGDGSALTGIAGSGDVDGPASATDNAVTRFDSTTGKLIQNSAVTIDDSGNIATAGTVDGVDVSGIVSNATHTGDVTGSTALTIAAGAVDIPMLSATGTPDSSTYLRGDNTWAAVSGSGDVVGPASSTDNAVTRFDSTTGKLVQNSAVTIDDSGNIATAGTVDGVDVSSITSNATHTGDVTGATALTIDKTAITGKTDVTMVGTDSVLFSDASDTGNLKEGLLSDLSSIVTGLTDSQISDTLTSSSFVGTGSTTNAVDLGTAEIAGNLPVTSLNGGTSASSGTYWRGDGTWASIVVGLTALTDEVTASGSGSQPATLASPAITNRTTATAASGDLLLFADISDSNILKKAPFSDISALITGLADSQVSNTLTASNLVGSGSTTNAVDLATAEVAGDLPLANVAQIAQNTIAGRAISAGTGDITALTPLQVRTILQTPSAVTSTTNSVAWNSDNAQQFTHTLSENTTIAASSGTLFEGQIVIFLITQAAGNYTLAWNSQFVAGDTFTAAIPAVGIQSGDISSYIYRYSSGAAKLVLLAHSEY